MKRGRQKLALLLPNLGGGGAERVAVNLANSFAKRGYAVDMVLLSATGDFLCALNPEIRVVDLQVGRFRETLLPLARYLRRERPDAVLANMWPLTLIAVVARAISRVCTCLIVAEHTTWSRSELLQRRTVRWQVRTSMRYAFPHANGIVAVSRGAADDLARFTGLNRQTITTIYNPILGNAHSTVGTPLPPFEWWTGTHHRLLAVGTLTATKGYSTLLNAFACLRKRVDGKLLILGEGNSRAALEQQIKDLKLEESVFVPGFVRDTVPYYQHANIFVMSSIAEALPTVIIEALAAGTPVVSTDCLSGPREILADGKFGALVPVGDVAALTLAIEDALLSTHNYDALRARAADFSVDKAVHQYEALLFPWASKSIL